MRAEEGGGGWWWVSGGGGVGGPLPTPNRERERENWVGSLKTLIKSCICMVLLLSFYD